MALVPLNIVGVFDTDTQKLKGISTPDGKGLTLMGQVGNQTSVNYDSTNTITDQSALSAVRGAASSSAVVFTSRAVTASDNGVVFETATSQVMTINTGTTGFNGCAVYGPVTFAGTATIDDKRATGADAAVAYVQRLSSVDSFRVIGGTL